MNPGDVLELTIDKPAAGGEMIARVDGQVVFVAGAIPGERVAARVERVVKRMAHARVIDITTPSPDRRPGFADPLCGGCVYSHIAYPRQLAIKSDVIADAFARIAKLPLAAPVAVAPSVEEGYRMRARLHVRGQRLGFFREGTHDLCEARSARQLLPATNDALDRLIAAARSLGIADLREVELSENVAASERVVHVETTQPLEFRALEALCGSEGFTAGPYVTDTLQLGTHAVTLRRHVLAFFQGNRFLLRDFVAHVAALVPDGAAVADLYAGVGVFAIAAAVVRGAHVIAVEGDRWAAEDLHVNAASASGEIRTARGDVESFVSTLKAIDTVIVDPPRTGMTPRAVDGILRVRPHRLIYVSCDVATLARDARRIIDAGYGLTQATAFDLFPNTPHVETVVVFEKR